MKVTKANSNLFNSYRLTSIKQNWRTPSKVFELLNAEFKFTLDPCLDGIIEGRFIDWDNQSVFVNPPYNNIESWILKALNSKKSTIVFLLPVKTCVPYFHEYILPIANEIRFIKGRLKFDDQKKVPLLIVIS